MRRFAVFGVSLFFLLALAVGAVRADAPADGLYPPGLPEPGFLGINIRSVAEGLQVVNVQTDSPADWVGLRPGDVIVAQADPLTPTLLHPFKQGPVGARTILHVKRGSDTMTFTCSFEPLTPEWRRRLERRAANLTGIGGQVEVVAGRRLGIRLFMPAARIVRLKDVPGKVQRDGKAVGEVRFVGTHDDWRIVAEVPEGGAELRPDDVVTFELIPQQVATTWGRPDWTPSPSPSPTPYRSTSTRKIRVPRRVLDAHLMTVQEHYRVMLAALPPETREFGQTVTLVIDKDPELNAYAGLDRRGYRVIGLTRGMSELVVLLSYVIATLDERSVEASLAELGRMALARAMGATQFPLPKGFVQRTRDPAVLREINECAAPIYTFVLGHELGHHLLGFQQQDDSLLGHALSREEEKQADALGAEILHLTGGNKTIVLIFTMFMASAEDEHLQQVPEYLRDHPDWRSRTSFLEGVFATQGG